MWRDNNISHPDRLSDITRGWHAYAARGGHAISRAADEPARRVSLKRAPVWDCGPRFSTILTTLFIEVT